MTDRVESLPLLSCNYFVIFFTPYVISELPLTTLNLKGWTSYYALSFSDLYFT
jgi:hypothetical protein